MFFRRSQRSDLDNELMKWSPVDPFTVREACQNTLIVGKTGSGKSSGSGAAILNALVQYRNSGGLWLASKPEDRDYAIRLFRRAGRADDLIIMEPGGAERFNILDYEMKRGARPRSSLRNCSWCWAKRSTGRRAAAGRRRSGRRRTARGSTTPSRSSAAPPASWNPPHLNISSTARRVAAGVERRGMAEVVPRPGD